jgi:carbon monoxide dehydrogenase subunit G
MRLSESHTLPVPLDETWAALNDLALLQQALPGCESLLEIAPDEFVGEMAIPLGLATSRFTIYVHRRDVDAPRRCTLHFETRTTGANGAGSAALALAPDGVDATTLAADIAVQVDGLLASLGGPLVEPVAHRMAEEFFARLRAAAMARHATGDAPTAARRAPA